MILVSFWLDLAHREMAEILHCQGPFKCYVTQMGVGVRFSGKKRYEGVMFNVINISVTRGWVGVQFPAKQRYVTLEWPRSMNFVQASKQPFPDALVF